MVQHGSCADFLKCNTSEIVALTMVPRVRRVPKGGHHNPQPCLGKVARCPHQQQGRCRTGESIERHASRSKQLSTYCVPSLSGFIISEATGEHSHPPFPTSLCLFFLPRPHSSLVHSRVFLSPNALLLSSVRHPSAPTLVVSLDIRKTLLRSAALLSLSPTINRILTIALMINRSVLIRCHQKHPKIESSGNSLEYGSSRRIGS